MDVQTQSALSFMTGYDLIDIEILETDGKTALFRGVVWDSRMQATVDFGGVFTDGLAPTVHLQGSLSDGMEAFLRGDSELREECREACAYHRDLLRAKN
jgi:hypothetical protein